MLKGIAAVVLISAAAGMWIPACFGRTAKITGAEVTLIEVGEKAPDFKLFGVDLKYHSIAMYRDKTAVVLVFHCNHCPVSRNNVERLVRLGNEYQAKNIQFLIINPNPVDKVAADGFMEMIKKASESNLPFPYLYDETQATAFAYGARRTDHVFVLGASDADGARRVKFIGPIDNRGTDPVYLADVLDALLAGEKIEDAEVAAFGCTIKYRTAEERIARFGVDIFNAQ